MLAKPLITNEMAVAVEAEVGLESEVGVEVEVEVGEGIWTPDITNYTTITSTQAPIEIGSQSLINSPLTSASADIPRCSPTTTTNTTTTTTTTTTITTTTPKTG